jgi:hypothetical protein
MGKTKIDKETAVKSILSDLKKGIDKPTILRKIATKCDKDKATIYRWYNEAEKKYKPYLKKIQEVENQTIEKVVSEMVTSNIMSIERRKQRLSEIAEQIATVQKEVVNMGSIVITTQYPSFSDAKSCIDILNKMDGAYINDIETDNEITEITIRTIDGT